MHKKAMVVLLSCMLSVTMLTGCSSDSETHIKLFGKEIFSREKDDKTIDDGFEGYEQQTPSSTHTADEAVEAIVKGNYSITYNSQDYTVQMEDVLDTLFPNYQIYTQVKDENTWLVKFQSEDNYIIFRLSFITGTLTEQELCYNGTTLTETNSEAHQGLLQLIVTEIINKEGATNDEGKSTVENKKEEKDNEPTDFDDRAYQSKCKYCGKSYYPSQSNDWDNEEFCSKQCHVDYDEKQASKNEQKYKYYCAQCGKGYRPDSSSAIDNYSFCSEGCESKWYDNQQKVVDDYQNGIDHSACKNCGKEIGLNGYKGYCYDCGEKLGIGR